MGVRFVLPGLLLMLAAGCEQSGYSHSASRKAVAEAEKPEVVSPDTASRDTASPDTATVEVTQTAASEVSTEPSPADEKQPAEAAAPFVLDGSANPERKLLPIKTITFDDLKFDIEKDSKFQPSMLAPQIKELVGRKVRVRGFILPTFQTKIRNFILTRDNLECCFGPGAAIYDCVKVDLVPEASATEFTTRVVTVEGVLTLREVLDFEGITRALYHLDATSVK